MLINNQDGNEKEGLEVVRDSPKNKSRVTVEYQFNVESDLLGTGGYGEVYKVKKRRGTLVQKDPYYALKIFNKINLYKENDKGSRILTEIKIHRSLNHEHICKYEHSFEDKRNVYILMEYCENGTLASYIRTRKYLEEYEIRFYMFQVLSVLKYLRREKIIHRDLTLGNIFLKDLKTVKIGDFGFAYKDSENDEKTGVICGTPGYFTPESNNSKYSFKTDIFDFGVCIYYLFGGKPLFKTSSESAEVFSNKELQFDKKLKYSVEALDLLNKTVTVENQRIDLDEIYRHPFFNKGKGLSKDKFPEYNENNKEQFFKDIKEIVIREGLKLTPIHHETKNNYSNNVLSDGSNSNGVLSSNDSLHPNLLSRNNSGLQSGKNVSFNVNENSPYNKTNRNGGNSLVYGSGYRSTSKNKDNSKNSDIFRENLRKSLAQFQIEDNLKKINKEFNKDSNNSINSITEENKQKKNRNKNEDGKFDFNPANNTLAGTTLFDLDNEKDSETIISISKKNINTESSNNKMKIKNKSFIFITNVINKLTDFCGIGYELNNKNIGVYFNDNTQMIKIFGNYKYIIYLYKDFLLNKMNHIKIDLPPVNISSDKKKKISFLVHIIEEFSKINKNKPKKILNDNVFSPHNSDNKNIKTIEDENYEEEEEVYLKKYKKTHKAYFFVLSNKNIQTNFFDKTKIIFTCIEPKKITYFNKNEEMMYFPVKNNFCDFKCDDVEINKKIKYAIKEINK